MPISPSADAKVDAVLRMTRDSNRVFTLANVYKLLFLNIFSLLLGGGCASLPAPAPEDDFLLRGKLSVEEAGERHTANLLWRQQGENFEVDLWGPMGQGRIQLVRRGSAVAILDGAGVVVTEGPSEQVMREQLGWSLPLAVLPAWLQGAPLAGIPAQDLEYDAQGLLAAFTQLEWRVVYEQHREAAGQWLPRRLSATGPATRIRLVIAEWQF